MGLPVDLEALRAIFADRRLHLVVGVVTQLSMSPDRSVLKCKVSVFPDQREIVARMTWDAVGTETGIFAFPSVDDLVLVGFAEGDFNSAFILRRMTSASEKIPVNAAAGDTVVKAPAGKNAWITGQQVHITRGDVAGSEPLVLGMVLKQLLTDILAELKKQSDTLVSHTHVCSAPGAPSAPPTQAADLTANGTKFDALKGDPVGNGGVLSAVGFTEKGA